MRPTLLSAAALCLAGVPAQAGTVRGKVTFQGKPPAARRVHMQADPKCAAQSPGGLLYQPVAVGPGGGLADAFVYVKKGLEGRKFEAPREPKTLDQRGCWYRPRVLGLMTGQKLELLNSDPVAHNVNALPEFNVSMPPGVKKLERSFSKPQVMVKVKCNAHPWMIAYAGVVEHPFYAVSGADGSYELRGLPPGRYTLEAWHEGLGALAREVVVPAAPASDQSAKIVDFSFSRTAAP